MIAFMGTFP